MDFWNESTSATATIKDRHLATNADTNTYLTKKMRNIQKHPRQRRSFYSSPLWIAVISWIALLAVSTLDSNPAILTFHFVEALPQFIVINGRPKCFTVEVPKMTMLRVHYEAPDIETDPNSNLYSPTYITLLERPVESAASYAEDDDDDRQTSVQNKLNRMKQNKKKDGSQHRPVSKEITSNEGSFTERIHEDAVVDVCVRASGAGLKRPMRFGIRTEEIGDELTALEREFDEKKTTNTDVDHHFTFLEAQMDRIEHEMHTIISEADFFKERDSIYHQQTNDLHEATTFWPILHIIILIVTGFTQANHIVRFFKAHRII